MNPTKLLYTCSKTSALTRSVIDNTLRPLFILEKGLDRSLRSTLKDRYEHLYKHLPVNWAQIVIEIVAMSRLFGDQGEVKAYLKHPQVMRLTSRERDFLDIQIKHPWEIVLMRVLESLGHDIFTMEDLLSGESFLLYSPGVGKYEAEGRMSMYLTLRSFNGQCYQTYGPISYFKGLQPLDVLFFAHYLDPTTKNFTDLYAHMQRDPIPFMALLLGAEYPLTMHKSDVLMFCASEIEVADLDLSTFSQAFSIQEQAGVYELGLKRWQKHPHFAIIHYAPEDKKLVASALTKRGYDKLVETLAQLGCELPERPELYATSAGKVLTEEILDVEIEMSPYAGLFNSEVAPETQEELVKINRFLDLLIMAHNAGDDYDTKELAEETGIADETATSVAAHFLKLDAKIKSKKR